MNRYVLSLLLLIFTTQVNFAQHTEVQFPRLNYQMKMNTNLEAAASYFVQGDIIAGDKSGIAFSMAVEGNDVSLESDITGVVDLNSLKFTITPVSYLNFHAFYGRYKFLAEDLVLPNSAQHNYSPGANLYGIMPICGSGMAITSPISYGKYIPEIILFSSHYDSTDYLNLFLFSTFKYHLVEFQLYTGISFTTLGQNTLDIKYSGGGMVYTVMEYVNVYFSTYVSPFYGEEFTFDDVYMRLSQHLLIGMIEQSFSFTTLGTAGDNRGDGEIGDIFVGYNDIADINIYLSLGARFDTINVGVGAEYGFVYGWYSKDIADSDGIISPSHRFGLYGDIQYLGITYRAGFFYTTPNSGAYNNSLSSSGEVGFYVSAYGRA